MYLMCRQPLGVACSGPRPHFGNQCFREMHTHTVYTVSCPPKKVILTLWITEFVPQNNSRLNMSRVKHHLYKVCQSNVHPQLYLCYLMFMFMDLLPHNECCHLFPPVCFKFTESIFIHVI